MNIAKVAYRPHSIFLQVSTDGFIREEHSYEYAYPGGRETVEARQDASLFFWRHLQDLQRRELLGPLNSERYCDFGHNIFHWVRDLGLMPAPPEIMIADNQEAGGRQPDPPVAFEPEQPIFTVRTPGQNITHQGMRHRGERITQDWHTLDVGESDVPPPPIALEPEPSAKPLKKSWNEYFGK